ncbi:VOC family protein [Xylocopilactobacillus apis]|uniref:Glyoxalase n=1 Tax=Xylocopilactobacillus apis TaxID=2932183 RepID=A0AAU9DNB9_9LACO|nr:VOC family protein [Xylocopilactobacillus apis]BDR57214.1 glyoxalase [Xylocopilactobacillus apis]
MDIHHISLLTEDLELNIKFYTKTLGLRFVKNSVNQAYPRRRHIYYGDFMGTPGTVVTFFPVSPFQERVDGDHYWSGIHFAIPRDSLIYWRDRLQNNGFKPTVDSKHILHVLDHDGVHIQFKERSEELYDWHINYKSDIPATKQITRIIGTDLHVPNIEKTAQFFTDLMGLNVRDQKIVLGDREEISLFETPSDAPKKRWGRGSVDHFALAVESSEELHQYWDRAQENGWTRELLTDRGYFRSAYFIEPGGCRVELATINPGFTVDESLYNLGTTFSLPPILEKDRKVLTDFYAEKNVNFDEVEPYTGNGYINNQPLKPLKGDVKNMSNK